MFRISETSEHETPDVPLNRAMVVVKNAMKRGDAATGEFRLADGKFNMKVTSTEAEITIEADDIRPWPTRGAHRSDPRHKGER